MVSELSNDTFYAKIVLGVNGSSVEVDCRPSDAIALAVRSEAPIFAEEAVLEKASVQMDAETGKPIVSGEQTSPKPLREEELKTLSAFTDFVSTLDLDDIGERLQGVRLQLDSGPTRPRTPFLPYAPARDLPRRRSSDPFQALWFGPFPALLTPKSRL